MTDLAGNKDIIIPVHAFNVANVDSRAGNKLAMQEFMILSTGVSLFKEAMRMGSEKCHHLKSDIGGKFGLDATSVGDGGGFSHNILDDKE